MTLVFPSCRGKNRSTELKAFADEITKFSQDIGYRVSSRGWGYLLEQEGLITKAEFDKVETIINECREKGYLPINFVADEEGRGFSGVDVPNEEDPEGYLIGYLEAINDCKNWYTPDWWEGEEYYIQMLVEKIDLKTLFEPVCKAHHIPIATSKGWSSMLQRAEYTRRFKDAEQKGLKCVLLYCGDHDPDGLRISETIRKNLEDVKNIRWADGETGYDPVNLIIDRFGLNFDFIVANNLTWIDNLITSSGKSLADPNHNNHAFQYVQDYLKKYGVRKCEGNALMIRPQEAKQLCLNAIQKYVGRDAESRSWMKRKGIINEFNGLRTGVRINGMSMDDFIEAAIGILSGDTQPDGSVG